MRLHALDSVDVEGLASKVNLALLGGDGASSGAPGPEGVAHGAPGVCQVGSEECLARLARLEARALAGDLEVDNGPLVIMALDGIVGAILGELEGTVVGVEIGVILAEVDVVQRGGAPQVWFRRVAGEDLDVELGGDSDTTVMEGC